MSLPGVEVPIEKCLPKILLRLGKENPSQRQCKVARLYTAQVRCDVVSFGTISVRYVHLVMTNLVHACSCSSACAGRAGRKDLRLRRKVDKCRVADKKQTNKPIDKHTLLFYRYRLAVHAEPCSATVPSQDWAAEKQT